MTESNDAGAMSPSELLRRVLTEAGASHALFEALRLADLRELPGSREEMFRFLDGPLERALVGILHPASVAHVLATVREKLADIDKSGTRMKSEAEPPPEDVESADSLAATSPPPADAQAAEAYDDLVSGAIHSRVTPAWGLRVVDPTSRPGAVVWVIVSNDPELQRTAATAAPKAVDVVAASSMAVLKGALNRADSNDSAVVLDASNPSIGLDRAIGYLTSDAVEVRVVLWRMATERRLRLIEAIPQAHSWLPCEAEVTPREIIMLLGV